MQIFASKLIQQLFPDEDVRLNYSHPDLLFEKSKALMELDIFLPSLSLAFEIQGAQHYAFHYQYGRPLSQQVILLPQTRNRITG